MPIYAYKCESCGFAKDVLQKMSDAPLTECPSCAKPSFQKQVTAAGFQLKGSGWYVTDFRGGANGPANGGASAPATGSDASTPAAASSSSTTGTGSTTGSGSGGSSGSDSASKPSTSSTTPAASTD